MAEFLDYKLAQRIEVTDAAIAALQRSKNAKPFTKEDDAAHYDHETAMTQLNMIYTDLAAIMSGTAMAMGTTTEKVTKATPMNATKAPMKTMSLGVYTADATKKPVVSAKTKLAIPKRRGRHFPPEKVAALMEALPKIKRSRKTVSELAAENGVSNATICRMRQGTWTP